MSLSQIITHHIYKKVLLELPTEGKCVINTINAYSYCEAKKDKEFLKALLDSTVLLPDGVSMVLAAKLLNRQTIQKIAGADIHQHLLTQANLKKQKVFYLGASESTLQLITTKLKKEFPNIVVTSYSPPYKKVFSKEDNALMLKHINAFKPEVLFVGMTAPKQEKWVHAHKAMAQANTIVSIGAVFDFYAGTVNRAPKWMIKLGLEWLYRLVKEPKRMWRRYLIGNTRFLFLLGLEKLRYIGKSKKSL